MTAIRLGQGSNATTDPVVSGEDQGAGANPAISVRGVSKTFSTGSLALQPVDLDIQAGELVSIVGPSGCGKSTLLRIIAGLTTASTGNCASPLK